MNAPEQVPQPGPPAAVATATGLRLHELVLLALRPAPAAADAAAETASGPERAWLDARAAQSPSTPAQSLQQWLQLPPRDDRLLHALARSMALSAFELLATALAAAVELDVMAGRVTAWLQQPLGSSRPSVGLLQAATAALDLPDAQGQWLGGPALRSGLLQVDADTRGRPLVEQALCVPLPVVLALSGGISQWPGVTLRHEAPELAAEDLDAAVQAQARALAAGRIALQVRSGHPREAESAAVRVALAAQQRAACFDEVPGPGFGIWLTLIAAWPVWRMELGPGETRRLPAWPGWRGPVLVATGPEGAVVHDGDTLPGWLVPLPDAPARSALWRRLLASPDAARLGPAYRHGTARLHALARAAAAEAALEGPDVPVAARHVASAVRGGMPVDLGTLAEPVPDAVDDEGLVLPPALRDALHALRRRCVHRERLADGLGPAARSRYRPGVRALFVGPSGTGKTLAAAWLATQLGLPLYRVDLAAMTSKYIGETEKNLAQLFARSEHAEVVLLFDEADALFSRRTEVKESNDRFANGQTNYLLQRIESFDGIALLTSNSRSRFDPAFTRRLDTILEFPSPAPEQRRALWSAHLGTADAGDGSLDSAALNRLAALCDLTGGHIRNAVLAAAAAARAAGRPIDEALLGAAVEAEYEKLGKTTPAGLRGAPR
jgi:hypothetical protein